MAKPVHILGISALYHDSAAVLLRDGEIVAAAQEERFSRKKHDSDFPAEAIAFCLRQGGLGADELDHVVFYDKPVLKFGRILESALAIAPRGLRPYRMALPLWLKEKLWMPRTIERALPGDYELLFCEHHQSHAASAFYPSPFESAAVLTIDGVGEWATTTIGHGQGSRLELLEELRFPHSLGLLYSAFTYHCGFKVNSGEYKLMGLAPYGEPSYADRIREKLIDLKEDGSYRLDLSYFDYVGGLKMTSARFDALFDGPPREPEGPLTRREMDLAASVQQVTEEVVFALARRALAVTGERRLCLAGGVALNCVANGKLKANTPVEEVWVQPAAGDAGGALGAALWVHHQKVGAPRVARAGDAMQGSLLGPEFPDEAIDSFLEECHLPHTLLEEEALPGRIADLLDEGKIVGWFQGRMEFGPRALGNRSILGDPRRADTQRTMNLKIKQRESFRPFAPAVLEEEAATVFDFEGPSPYMLMVAPVREERWAPVDEGVDREDVSARVNQVRSDLPAITHLDHSARLQTVDAQRNPTFHRLLSAFHRRTGCPVLVNTSFNVRGEPIVCTPRDAYRCFMKTEMDVLVLGRHLLLKREQPPFDEVDV
ncbi:MAG: carbamoyltransferase [Deltaproteobacteria bacterium]|nr:carbamoyltransferase [Deltaproteobacteria bacterium]